MVLYDGKTEFKPHDFKGVRGYVWKNDKPASPRVEGSLVFEDGGIMHIERTNAEGRFEINLRRSF